MIKKAIKNIIIILTIEFFCGIFSIYFSYFASSKIKVAFFIFPTFWFSFFCVLSIPVFNILSKKLAETLNLDWQYFKNRSICAIITVPPYALGVVVGLLMTYGNDMTRWLLPLSS